jgi:hypothetical protein
MCLFWFVCVAEIDLFPVVCLAVRLLGWWPPSDSLATAQEKVREALADLTDGFGDEVHLEAVDKASAVYTENVAKATSDVLRVCFPPLPKGVTASPARIFLLDTIRWVRGTSSLSFRSHSRSTCHLPRVTKLVCCASFVVQIQGGCVGQNLLTRFHRSEWFKSADPQAAVRLAARLRSELQVL